MARRDRCRARRDVGEPQLLPRAGSGLPPARRGSRRAATHVPRVRAHCRGHRAHARARRERSRRCARGAPHGPSVVGRGPPRLPRCARRDDRRRLDPNVDLDLCPCGPTVPAAGMILISYGITKSGSTLAFEMARAVLELNGYRQHHLGDGIVNEGHHINFVSGWTDERLMRLIEAASGTRVAIKTHTDPYDLSTGDVQDLIDAGEVRIHVVYRDPRDLILSMLEHADRTRTSRSAPAFRQVHTLDHAIERLGVQLHRFRAWGRYPSLKLQYERFAFDPVVGPALIADDLRLPADPERVWQMVGDEFTQLNVGVAGRHATDLAPDDCRRIERAFPLYLELVQGNDLGWFVD